MEKQGSAWEQERLAALAALGIMDSAPEPAYDEAVQLAAAVCKTPIGIVTLLDDQRQWFKARLGVDHSETARKYAFCDHAIREEDVFVVSDASLDPRFCDNPLVTGSPRIRFYAGMPFKSPDGHPLGTICVIDTLPRELDSEQLMALKILSRQIASQIGMRAQMIQLNAALAEKERLRKESSTSVALFESFMDNSPLVAFMKDEQGHLLYYNRQFASRFRISPDAWIGKNDFEIWPLEFAARYRQDDVDVITKGELNVIEETSPGPEESIIHWRTYKFPLRSILGEPLLAGLSLDTTREKSGELALQDSHSQLVAANKRLHELAVTDALTGLANRRAFDERLQEQLALAKRHGTAVSMLLFDVDNFKCLNDTYGHDEGDVVLREIAAVLRAGTRATDLVCRYGGEEFAVLLPNTEIESAATMGERMRGMIEDDQRGKHAITVSVGVSTHPELNEASGAASVSDLPRKPLTLPRMADLALYQAKSIGKNQIVCYEPGLDAVLLSR